MEIEKKNMGQITSKSNKSIFFKYYKKNGWVVVPNFFSKKEIKKTHNEIMTFLKKNFEKYKGRDINFVGEEKKISKINSFHRLHDCGFIKKLVKKAKVKKIAQTFLSTKSLELRASELFAKPKNTGLKVPIHQDNFYWNVVGGNALTIWIALSPSSKKNGGVFYYNNSHKNGVLPHKSSFAKGSSQTIKNLNYLKKFKKNYPKLNIGDALIHSCLVVHGSHKNKSQTPRKGLTFQFKPKESKYNYTLIRKYEKKLKHQISLRKK
jgi:ectoine hydroxylase-related dioxygenase (phytanoyl-CoA dioxygenase family)